MIKLDNNSAELLVAKLSGIASQVNIQSFKFSAELYSAVKDIDWSESDLNKTQLYEQIANDPNVHLADAGCLRQVYMVGEIVIEKYNSDYEKLKKINYWKMHEISRSRLVEHPEKTATAQEKIEIEEANIQKKVELIEDVINGDIKPGKVRSQINTIRDTEMETPLSEKILLFNSWSVKRIDKKFGVDHPGQIPGEIVLNVIHHYIPKDGVVVDPMSGGGSTHDVCEWINGKDDSYNLTCHSFDLAPRYEFNHYRKDNNSDIHQVCDEDGNNCKDRSFIQKKDALLDDWGVENADLVFLDPPYYSMMKDDYAVNLFTQDLPSFYEAIGMLMRKANNALKPGGLVALILCPQTEKDIPDGENYIDLPYESMKIMERNGFRPWSRIQTPLSTQQFSPQDVNRTKANPVHLMGISRDLIVMKKK